MKRLTTPSEQDDTGRRLFLKLSLAAGAAATVGLGAPAIAQETKVWRIGHMLPPTMLHSEAMVLFADEIAKLSDNKIKLEIFPSSQLGTIPEMLQSTHAGSQTFGLATPSWFSNYAKPLDAFSLPYLISSPSKLRAALDGKLGAKVQKLGEEVGFQFLGHYYMGTRNIANTKHTINSPEDLSGLKIRVINSQVYLETFRALGASPVTLDPSEQYVAMQQGIIDGISIPIQDTYSSKMYEVTKFLSLDAHSTDFFMVATSNKNWENFSVEEQQIVRAAAKAAMDWHWVQQFEDIEAAKERLQPLIAINEITPENRAKFVEATLPVHKEFEGAIGVDFLELVKAELA